MSAIPAAGTLPWRRSSAGLEVALVHRPRYNDWSWPKGKLDKREEWPVAAVRETHEETSLSVRLGPPLPSSQYTVITKAGVPDSKLVRYWAAQVVGGGGPLTNEVDEVAWLDVQAAYDRLDYARDRDQLLALVRAESQGSLATWPLVVVRHARALPRSKYAGTDDQQRPLLGFGRAQARALAPLLAAYGVTRLVSSPSVRCVDTVGPYAATGPARIRTYRSLSEEGYADRPGKARRRVRKVLAAGAPTAVCTHGPVLPAVLGELGTLAEQTSDPEVAAGLTGIADEGMDKGEALVLHVCGVGPQATVVALERYLAAG